MGTSIGPATSVHPHWSPVWTLDLDVPSRVFPSCWPLFTVTPKLHLMNNFCRMLLLKVRTCPNLRSGAFIRGPNLWAVFRQRLNTTDSRCDGQMNLRIKRTDLIVSRGVWWFDSSGTERAICRVPNSCKDIYLCQIQKIKHANMVFKWTWSKQMILFFLCLRD